MCKVLLRTSSVQRTRRQTQVYRTADKTAVTYAGRVMALLVNRNYIKVREKRDRERQTDRMTDTRPLL